jgi:Fatty acid/phospholipid biosynthesis enzyme
VRLLSIGEEPEKGNQLTLEAHELLAASDLDFRGNAEGRDVLEGAADVLVTDGFTGNVTLKAVEGTIRTLLDSLREEITASATGTVGGLLIRPPPGGCASASTPTRTAARTSSACAGSW